VEVGVIDETSKVVEGVSPAHGCSCSKEGCASRHLGYEYRYVLVINVNM